MKIKIIKNYYLFFDNSHFSKDGDSLKMEVQSFRAKKNALRTINELKNVKQVSFIIIWRKKTKVCYIYKYEADDWIKEKEEIIKKMEIVYKFKTKKKLVIKEFEEKRDCGN